MIVAAVAALAVGSTALIVLLTSPNGPSANGAYGHVTCPAPQLGSSVHVTLTAAGYSMMSQEPMMASLTGNPAAVSAGKVSFVASN